MKASKKRRRKRKLKPLRILALFIGFFVLAYILVVLITQFLFHPIFYNYNFTLGNPLSDIPRNSLRNDSFTTLGNGRIVYDDGVARSVQGIDVSSHNGDIDWRKVKEDGIEFVFIRIGYRGYRNGGLSLDERFEEYYRGASENGLKIGVYFFSQAVDKQESMEEAYFVLEQLRFKKIDLPIVYDYEQIDYDDDRISHLSPEIRTENACAFVDKIIENEYQAMIYANVYWSETFYDMHHISKYPFWLAYYKDLPDFPYRFRYWQYSENGRVDGIDTDVDMNLFFPA